MKISPCCGKVHPFDAAHAVKCWRPSSLRCLIIGESPGAPGADYFYDPIPAGKRDPIVVRRLLLRALAETGSIDSATLEAFKDAGFLFDHAIRCQLPLKQIEEERDLAARFAGQLMVRSSHLIPLIEEAEFVWVMGRIARNAVAHLHPSFLREARKLTPPYHVDGMAKFVVSKYFTRFDRPDEVREIARFATGRLKAGK